MQSPNIQAEVAVEMLSGTPSKTSSPNPSFNGNVKGVTRYTSVIEMHADQSSMKAGCTEIVEIGITTAFPTTAIVTPRVLDALLEHEVRINFSHDWLDSLDSVLT
ncbi:hypothetical protein BDZ45DRAFT_671961 [Acephala macrosclerotiorum]|nr:hypothetical protein BDZ45DRAFT_671961 [Acephala macrosclerotiorum]